MICRSHQACPDGPIPLPFGVMCTLTVSLPDSVVERLEREAKRRSLSADALVLQALERAIPSDEEVGQGSVFERLSRLMVNDPASATDLATNKDHLEGLGVSRSA